MKTPAGIEFENFRREKQRQYAALFELYDTGKNSVRLKLKTETIAAATAKLPKEYQ